ncbi:amidohydrolase [Rothia sp. 32237D007AR]
MTYLPASLSLTAADQEHLLEEYKAYHASPELSLQEYETTRKIRERAQNLLLGQGVICDIVPIGETGTVVILRNGEGPTVAYRADIDGLPVTERTGLPYASTAVGTWEGETVGVMHACGHDSHITMGLKTMDLFARDGSDWAGTIEFIFQPGEEGKDGAKLMVSQGLWQTVPVPSVMYGQHVFPFEAGKVIVTTGPLTSAVDSLGITLHGKGGHGSQPQDTIDPVVLAAHLVVRLQTVVAREVAPSETAVLTVGSLHAGKKENIIPDSAEIRTSIRTFNPQVRQRVLAAVERIAQAEALASGAPAPDIINYHYSNSVVNDEQVSTELAAVFTQELGSQQVTFDPNFYLMASEDFGELGDAANIPYCFWILGGMTPEQLAEEPIASNHSPFFAPQPEPTLQVGVRAAVSALYSQVKR